MLILLEDIDTTDEIKELFVYLIQKLEAFENELIMQKREVDEYKVLAEARDGLLKKISVQNAKIITEHENIKLELQKCGELKEQSKVDLENILDLTKNIKKSIKEHENRISDIEDDLEQIGDDIYEIEKEVIKNDQYSRRNNLIISGIPERITQNKLENSVVNLLREINCHVTPGEIEGVHRLLKDKSSRYPAKVIVRFTNRRAVEYCLKNNKLLRESKVAEFRNIRFFQNLCPKNEAVVKKCTYLQANNKIHDYKITNGYAVVIKEEGDRQIKIKHPYDLDNLIEVSDE